MATTVLALVIYVFVVARCTRIIVLDKIGSPLRSWAGERWPSEEPLAPGAPVRSHPITFALHCYACVSVWFGVVLCVPAALVAGVPLWWSPALALAASQAALVLRGLESD
ncbi:hypothetical protein [Nocardia asiatica]|uniref:hypothetical protein n=1 Tax=Nocardia asiatica TaxID=209252 RepID=UPI0024549CAE|nr:hypothetical protein [Nocardia asiatica]